MMKRALLIGIDTYDAFDDLGGCVNDVRALSALLSQHEDGSPNFDKRLLCSGRDRVERRATMDAIDVLLAPGADISLFYFAGHGSPITNDAVLVTQDASRADEGVLLSTLLTRIQQSSVREVIVLLDCCFGGAGGVPQLGAAVAALREGVSLLSASRGDQPAGESGGRGLFSIHLCGALAGGAADVLGKVTVASVYAYLSESFGPWDQRPTFKANLDRLHELRRCAPAVPLEELRRLPDWFSDAEAVYPLDPSYEPDATPAHEAHQQIFAILQKCRAAKLVEPVGAEHMYYAAMHRQSCRLTSLGKHYHRMAVEGRL